MSAISATVCIGTRRLYLSVGYCCVICKAFPPVVAKLVSIKILLLHLSNFYATIGVVEGRPCVFGHGLSFFVPI